MKVLDCFFGQVRAVKETWKGMPNTWTPAVLDLPTSRGVTWDNATGMNPLFDQATVPVEYYSYGKVISIASALDYDFVNDFIEPGHLGKYYDTMIARDYKSHYARLAQNLATLAGMHYALSQNDARDFDFVVTRQFDTWWKPNTPDFNERIHHILHESAKIFTGSGREQNIPIAYTISINLHENPKEYVEFPVVGATRSLAMIFNKAAVEVLYDEFLYAALDELEIMYKQADTDLQSNLQSWQIGYNIHRILTKFNIHTIDITHHNVIGGKPGWAVPCHHDFSHTARATGSSD